MIKTQLCQLIYKIILILFRYFRSVKITKFIRQVFRMFHNAPTSFLLEQKSYLPHISSPVHFSLPRPRIAGQPLRFVGQQGHSEQSTP